MDGILLIDKASGMTSHDVVAWARRRLGQRGIGHAGTLDPMATGLLVLMVGKATRLASLLTGKDKTYDATIRLGFETDTDDADGTPTVERAADLPSDSRIQEALETFMGTFPQMPPAHSAKKVGGTRAYELARQDKPVRLNPVEVTTREMEWHGRQGDLVRLQVTVSAGFYVRALARDLGRRLGCGAHLATLRRVRSGSFVIGAALGIEAADALGPALADRLITPAAALPDLPAVELTPPGLTRVLHGNAVGPAHLHTGVPVPGSGIQAAGPVRILAEGRLVALGAWRAGALHPIAVLG